MLLWTDGLVYRSNNRRRSQSFARRSAVSEEMTASDENCASREDEYYLWVVPPILLSRGICGSPNHHSLIALSQPQPSAHTHRCEAPSIPQLQPYHQLCASIPPRCRCICSHKTNTPRKFATKHELADQELGRWRNPGYFRHFGSAVTMVFACRQLVATVVVSCLVHRSCATLAPCQLGAVVFIATAADQTANSFKSASHEDLLQEHNVVFEHIGFALAVS